MLRIKDTLLTARTKAVVYKDYRGGWTWLKPLGMEEFRDLPAVVWFDSFNEVLDYINRIRKDDWGYYVTVRK